MSYLTTNVFKKILICAFLGSNILLFQNCGQSFRIKNAKQQPSETKNPTTSGPITSGPNTPPNTPLGDGKNVPGCLSTTSSEFNACIFYKNPVVQHGGKMDPPPYIDFTLGEAITNLDQIQTMAVQLPADSLDTGEYVMEPTGKEIFTQALPYRVAQPENGQWKFGFQGDKDFKLLQVMNSYWLNQQAETIEQINGSYYGKAKQTKVVPLIPEVDYDGQKEPFVNAAWLGVETNHIILGITIPKEGVSDLVAGAFSLDGGVVVHEAGHGNFDFATNGALHDTDDNIEGLCPDEQGYCCKTVNGCASAMHEGVADVHTLIMFPGSTAMGEMISNDLVGMGSCNKITRDVAEFKKANLKGQDGYDACGGAINAPGEAHAMGTVYASLWYGVFQRAKARGGATEERQAHKLFYEHLKLITGKDSFLTAKDSIKNLDRTLFNGKFSQDLDAEYSQMGY